jgi:hypothetical protein
MGKKNGAAQEAEFNAPKAADETAVAASKETQQAAQTSTGQNASGIADETAGISDGENKISVTLRHKTEFPFYRRAGLILKQTAAVFSVTAEELDILKKDPWVVIVHEGEQT